MWTLWLKDSLLVNLQEVQELSYCGVCRAGYRTKNFHVYVLLNTDIQKNGLTKNVNVVCNYIYL